MAKRVSAILLTLMLIISTMSAVSFTAYAANNSRQLMAVGNQLVFVDEPTTTVRLTGVNVPGGEWTGTPGVERIERSVTWAIDNWKANVIRLPVSTKGWYGEYDYVYDGGNNYRKYIDSCIQIASDRGAYVILDFHHYKSFEKEQYINFWKDAAVRYKNNPTVLFGILNEPHSTSWEVWRNGDGASVYGHQYVVEMIRDLGAKNIIVAGGLDWGYKLGGVATEGYALVDQGANNNKANAGYGIMYDSHIYPWKGHTSDWDKNVGAARKQFPVLIGECGWDIGTINEIAGKNPQPGDKLYHDKWCPELLAWMDDDTTYGAKANYTAYCMHPSSAPQLISSTDANGYGWKDANYSYTPNEYWGAYLVPHLQASVNTRYGTLSTVKVTAMSVINPKTEYNIGDSFDKSVGKLNVSYSDGTTAQVAFSDSGVTISGFNSSAASESQTITVAYSGATATYTIVINDSSAPVAAKSYLDLDFTDAAYAKNDDGSENYWAMTTTNKATGNQITVNFEGASDTNRYQVYDDNGNKYIATKGRKTQVGYEFSAEEAVSDKTNLVYVEAKVKRTSYNLDDPVSMVVTDDAGNAIFRLNYKQNVAPVLVADATYDTVTYPVNGDWTYVRAIIDFSTSKFELYQGTSLSSLTPMVEGTTSFGFASAAANVKKITNIGIGDKKGSLGFDDIKIYTVGEGGGDVTTPVTLSSIAVSNPQTAYNYGDVFVAPAVTATYSDGSSKTVTGASFSGYNMSAAGEQTVSVSYGGKSTSYKINVTAPEKVVASLTVSDAKTQYTYGDTFVAPKVIATYEGSYYPEEEITDVTFTGYNMNTASTQTVRVIYNGKAMASYTITVSAPAKVIASITVTSPKTDYNVGDIFVVPSIIVKYTSDYYTNQIINSPTCTGYNMSQAGVQTVNVSYGGHTTTYNITVNDASAPAITLTSIAVSNAKTAYNVGDAFVEPTVTATYSDGSTAEVEATFTGYNMSNAGTQTVTVAYGGKSTTYQITVTAVVVPPTETNFVLEVGKVSVEKGTATVEVPLNITKFYEDNTIAGLSFNIDYDTTALKYTAISFGDMIPDKADMNYTAAGKEVTPGRIYVEYTALAQPITSAAIKANNLYATITFDVLADVTSEIKITPAADLVNNDLEYLIYQDELADCLKSGSVTVKGDTPVVPEVTLTSIAVSNAKTAYNVGDAFVKPTVTATYSDGTTKTVEATFTGYNMSNAGTQTVTVAYDGKSTTYQITVTKPVATLTSISVSNAKTNYILGEAFVEPTVTATYSDGSTKDVSNDATYAGFDNMTASTQIITVTYNGQTTTYTVSVIHVMPPFTDTEFVFEVGNVKAEKGTATVEVPLNITKFYEDNTIAGLSFNIDYDTTALKYTAISFGDMIPDKADMNFTAAGKEVTPGRIYVEYTALAQPITSAAIKANNLYATITFDVLADVTSEIKITPAADLVNNDLEYLIYQDELADCLKSGSVTIEGKNHPGYHATVTPKPGPHHGFGHGDRLFHYVKQFILNEGNGNFIIKIGDFELIWSVERKCYVGASDPGDYISDDNTFNNVTITEGKPKTIQKYCDVTGDGRINTSDIAAMKNYMELGIDLTNAYAGDANIDGNLNITDFSIMKNHIELDAPNFKE